MGIRYYKLFDLLNRRGMKKSDLRAILSSATIAKLSKGDYISGEAVEKICAFLDCQPGDIMEYVVDAIDAISNKEVELAVYPALLDNDGILYPEPTEFNAYYKDKLNEYTDI